MVETILPGVHVLFGVTDISEDGDQAFDAGFQFDESARKSVDVGDAAGESTALLSGYFARIPATDLFSKLVSYAEARTWSIVGLILMILTFTVYGRLVQRLMRYG